MGCRHESHAFGPDTASAAADSARLRFDSLARRSPPSLLPLTRGIVEAPRPAAGRPSFQSASTDGGLPLQQYGVPSHPLAESHTPATACSAPSSSVAAAPTTWSAPPTSRCPRSLPGTPACRPPCRRSRTCTSPRVTVRASPPSTPAARAEASVRVSRPPTTNTRDCSPTVSCVEPQVLIIQSEGATGAVMRDALPHHHATRSPVTAQTRARTGV